MKFINCAISIILGVASLTAVAKSSKPMKRSVENASTTNNKQTWYYVTCFQVTDAHGTSHKIDLTGIADDSDIAIRRAEEKVENRMEAKDLPLPWKFLACRNYKLELESRPTWRNGGPL